MSGDKWDQIPGWFDYQDVYDQAVDEAANFETFVEIGVGFGRSIAYLAEAANYRVTKRPRIYGVDPCIDDWDSDRPTWGANHAKWARELGGPYTSLVRTMWKHTPLALESVNILRCRSVQAARMFDPKTVWFAFIDGSHHYEDVAADLAAWEPLIKPGGILAGHDHTDGFPGVLRAVAERWQDGKTQQRGACWWRRVEAA